MHYVRRKIFTYDLSPGMLILTKEMVLWIIAVATKGDIRYVTYSECYKHDDDRTFRANYPKFCNDVFFSSPSIVTFDM